MPPLQPGTRTAADLPHTLIALLRSSLERHADRVAVEGSRWILTYRDIERESQRIALVLRAAGVVPGHMVPMLMGRSPRFVVAMLAVMRCGAAYVPVDPLSPRTRLETMIGQLSSPVVLVDGEVDARLVSGRQVLDVRAEMQRRTIASRTQPWPDTPADAPLYVMFTSGSTGVPKGVVVPHGGVARLVHDADYARFDADSRWSQIASLAFDASTLEVWAPLLHGGCCVIQETALPSLEELADFLVERRITDAWLTAALFNALVDDRIEALADLRQVLTGGERVSPLHARRCLERWPQLALINGYGPTENTTFSMCHRIQPADVAELQPVPIGRPIRGTSARVMQAGTEADAGTDCAPGVTGELWVGGAGVALGYLGAPELTQSRFVTRDGHRWYRTGDLVRRRADGIHEFIGRGDRQVKIQGHRIELDELERILCNCPGVGDGIVLVLGESAETRHLVGLYCGPDTDTVRAWLAAHLAASEMPHVLHRLERLPHNLNGKVDRPALMRMLADGRLFAHEQRGGADWQSQTERTLAEIWNRVLPGVALQRGSSFMQCGGTSLMALRVAADVTRLLGRQLEPIEVVRHPVLADLARVVESAPAASAPGEADCWHDGQAQATLSRSQQSLIQAARLDASGAAYLVHVAIVCDASISAERLRNAFETLCQRHPMLRTTATFVGERITARVLDRLPYGCWTEQAPPLDAPPSDRAWPEAILDVVERPLDLAHDGPMRVDLWPVADGRSLLVWTVHHFAVDDHGLRQGLADLDRILRAETLAPVYGSAFAFAAVERGGTDHAALRSQAQAVVEALSGHAPVLPPATRPGAEFAVPLQAASLQTLPSACRRHGMTPFSAIVVALGLAQQEVFGAPWRFVLTPFSRRSEPELAEPIGYLLDLRLIEAGARPGETALQVLNRVHRLLLDAQRPRFLPVHRLAEEVSALEPAVRPLLTQFAVTWRIDPHGQTALGGAPALVLPVPQRGARFGLTLHVESCGGALAARIEADAEAIADGRAARVGAAFASHLAQLCTLIAAAPVDSVAEAEAQALEAPGAEVSAHRTAAEAAWTQWIGHAPQGEDDHFLRNGGSSLLAMRLAASLRRSTGAPLDVGAFLSRPTFGTLCRMLDARQVAASTLVTFIGTQDCRRLMLVVPGARGGALGMYRLAHELHRQLPETWAVAIVDLQSIMERSPTEGRAWFFAQQLQQVVRDLGEERIGGVVGYSLGGLLGIDLLSSLDPAVARRVPLWMIDTYAPARLTHTRAALVKRVLVSFLRHPLETVALVVSRLRAKVSGSRVRHDEDSDDGPRWRQFLDELARRDVEAPTLSVTLIHSRIQARRAGLIRARGTNGFDPRRFGRFRTVDVEFDHDELRHRAAGEVAALLAEGASA